MGPRSYCSDTNSTPLWTTCRTVAHTSDLFHREQGPILEAHGDAKNSRAMYIQDGHAVYIYTYTHMCIHMYALTQYIVRGVYIHVCTCVAYIYMYVYVYIPHTHGDHAMELRRLLWDATASCREAWRASRKRRHSFPPRPASASGKVSVFIFNIYVCTYAHMCTFICVYVYIYVYLHMCIYVFA